MVAFAGNSLLCRMALADTDIDAASFTLVRLVSGAVVLVVLVSARQGAAKLGGNWWSALALFVYAAGFSFAYLDLAAATGALLLFGAVQVTMIGHGLWTGERLSGKQVIGVVAAIAGLLGLLLPGLEAPPLQGAALMLAAGVAWGVYSLRGRGAGDPTRDTAGNFLRAAPMAILLGVFFIGQLELDAAGVGLAVASGALASGLGYAAWYRALPQLRAATAATVQLSVPVLTAVGGVVFLAEPVTLRLVVASAAILGGVALVVSVSTRPRARSRSRRPS